MTNQSDTPNEPPAEHETPAHIPPIDFTQPTEDQMAEVRKGIGGENRADKEQGRSDKG